MTGRIHLAKADDLDRVLPMVAAYHKEGGIEADEAHRRAAIEPLLEGSPHGAVWLIGPRMAPVGYVAVAFGWSIEFGGMDGWIDEIWIREKVRRRGMGSEALNDLMKTLRSAGLKALHLEAVPESGTERLYRRLGFRRRDYSFMTWRP